MTFAGGHRGLLSLAFVPPDDRRALSSGVDDVAVLWDAETGQSIRRFAGAIFRFNRAAFTKDGRRALTDGDLGLRYWEIDTGHVLKTLPGPRFGFSTVALSPDEHVAAASGSDGLTFWNVDAEVPIRRIEDESALAITYSGDGQRAHWISLDNRLCEVDLRRYTPPNCVGIDAGRLDLAEVGPDLSLTSERYGSLSLWATVTGRKVKMWSAHKQAIDSLAFLPGLALAASAGEDHIIRVWNTHQAKLLFERSVPGFGTMVALSQDGTRVLYGTEAGELHVWTLGPDR